MDKERTIYFEHYGTPRHSGRYPWGSGENPYQHDSGAFMAAISKMRKDGMSDVEIARSMGISTTTLRARWSIATNEIKAAKSSQAWKLKEKGMSITAIAKRMGVPVSTVAGYLKNHEGIRQNAILNTVDVLKKAIDEKGTIDIGKGIEAYLGVSGTHLHSAVTFLKDEGYVLSYVPYTQLGTGYKSTLKVLSKPGTQYKDIMANRDKIDLPFAHEYLEDSGLTKRGIEPPASIDPKRVIIRFAEDGGKEMDGVIQLRRGVDDISLGNARYAQVRIKVGEDKYLKGMAMYTDDLPDGVDIRFNTNKFRSEVSDPMDALKNIKDDPENPFGSTIRQRHYIDANGEEKLSAINVVGSLKTANEEGSWGDWSKTISSQVLSKQPVALVKDRLKITYDQALDEYNEISNLTNPTVKKTLLAKYADERDSDAAHLQAAGFPRQAWHVILPFPDMPENEIYAPNYENGETVVLVRHPHGGKFEIPTLTVNNNSPSAKRAIEGAPDAVGINSKVAERLSGADFDGDTVLVIPNNNGAIKTSAPLEQLKDFSPSEAYPSYEGMPTVGPSTGFHKGREMGSVSNLITDMTIQGAPTSDLAKAVAYSMVVIDAEKHNLNWRQAKVDNLIPELKEKYQGGKNAGASTLISKANADTYVNARKLETTLTSRNIDPVTGDRIYTETGETYTKTDSKGRTRVEKKQQIVPRMSTVKDAFELSSGTAVEAAYATYANQMKDLARKARLEYLNTDSQKYSPSAKTTYSKEVDSLNQKLEEALKNSPLERQAQLKAGFYVNSVIKENPSMEKDEIKKLKQQALTAERIKNGASKSNINITPNEWEAIQAGAVSNNTLERILANTDTDVIRAYATPRASGNVDAAMVSRAKSMLASGIPQSEVAKQLGISTSTLYKAVHS